MTNTIDTQEETIVLRAVYGKQQGWIKLTPVEDSNTGELLGVDPNSGVTAASERKISDGHQFNLKKPADAIAWKWVKENKEIVNSLIDGLNEPSALYYIDRPDEIVKNRIKGNKLKFDASTEVRKLSDKVDLDGLRGISRLLGQNSEFMKLDDLQDFFDNKISQVGGAEKVLAAFSDTGAKTKLLFYKLLDTNTIKKETSGIYKYGEIILGVSMDSALIWLKDKRNIDVVGKMASEAFKRAPEGPAPDALVDALIEENIIDKL